MMIVTREEAAVTTDLFALPASANQVPPFTLFAFVATQSSNAFGANNVKSGTGGIDAASRSSWVGRQCEEWHRCHWLGWALLMGGL